MRINFKSHKFGKKLLISSAAIMMLSGVTTTIVPKQSGLIQTVQASSKMIKLGKYSKDNQCVLKFDPRTKTLHIKEGANDNTLGSTPIYQLIPTANRHLSKKRKIKLTDIKHISIDSEIALPGNCYWLFGKLPSLQDIQGLDKIDSSNVDSAESMFAHDKKLKKLDLSTWDSRSLRFGNKEGMFYKDLALEEVNVTGWDVKLGDSIFNGLDTTKRRIIGVNK